MVGTAGDSVWPLEGDRGAKLPHLCMLVNSRSGGGVGGELVRKLTCVPHCTILDLSPDTFAAADESLVSTSARVQVPPPASRLPLYFTSHSAPSASLPSGCSGVATVRGSSPGAVTCFVGFGRAALLVTLMTQVEKRWPYFLLSREEEQQASGVSL